MGAFGRARVVADRLDRRVRVRAFAEEHDFGLRQEDCFSVEGCPDALVQRVFCEKLVRSLASTGFQAGHEYVAVHGPERSPGAKAARLGIRRSQATPLGCCSIWTT